MKLFVNKAVQWNDGSRDRTGKVKQILGDHVVIKAATGEEYIVARSAVESPNKKIASATTIVVTSSKG